MEKGAQRVARDALPLDAVGRRKLELMECRFQLADDLLGTACILRRDHETHIRRDDLRKELMFDELYIRLILFDILRFLLLFRFFVFASAAEQALAYLARRFAQE